MRWQLGIATFGAMLVACSLIVDTDGLSSGGVGPSDAGGGLDAPADVAVGSDAGGDGDAIAIDPNCPNGQGLLTGAMWPMLGGCPTHGAQSRYKGPDAPVERGRVEAAFPSFSSAFLGADESVFWGTEDPAQYLLKVTPSGTGGWKGDVLGNVTPVGAIARDGSVVVSASSAIVGLRPDGSRLWSYETGLTEADVGITIGPDGTIYTGAQDGRIIALFPDGGYRWTFSLGGDIVVTDPSLGVDGTVYTSARDGKLYAITNGTKKWSVTLTTFDAGLGSSSVSTTAIGRDGTIYVGTAEEKLYAVRPDSAIRWVKDLDGRMVGMPAVEANGVYAMTLTGKVHAFTADGTARWVYDLGESALYGYPIVDADGVVYAASNSALHAIRPDGTRKWRFDLGGIPTGQPVIGASGRIYVSATNSPTGTRGTLRTIGP